MKKLWIIALLSGAVLVNVVIAQDSPWPQLGNDIVIKKSHHRGDVFPGFIEILEIPYMFDDLGTMKLNGEKIETLINIDEIVKLHRFEDSKKKDYASLMYIRSQKTPMLVHVEYKDILSMIKRASPK